MNVTIKSGTNELHGDLYEYLRNSAFDAKNYFNSHTAPIPAYRLNMFGFTVGGPLIMREFTTARTRRSSSLIMKARVSARDSHTSAPLLRPPGEMAISQAFIRSMTPRQQRL